MAVSPLSEVVRITFRVWAHCPLGKVFNADRRAMREQRLEEGSIQGVMIKLSS